MLSQIQERKLTRLFHVHDTNLNGYVERDDYERMVERIAKGRAWAVDDPDREALRKRILSQWEAIAGAEDPAGSGQVRLAGWLAVWNAVLQSAYESRVRDVSQLLWDTMDYDGNGRITREESHLWFDGYGMPPSMADVAFAKCDLNGDGYISRDEWLVLVDQFFFSMHPDDPGNFLFGPLDEVRA